MNFSESLKKIKTIFLDTAPVIYFIEAHDQFGPLVRQVIELMNENRIHIFTSVLTLSEVLPKPVELGNDKLVEKFKMYLKNGGQFQGRPLHLQFIRIPVRGRSCRACLTCISFCMWLISLIGTIGDVVNF